MRTYDIPYVKKGFVFPNVTVPLEEMSLNTIVKNYLNSCVKSYGKVSECMRCEPKCAYGKRAIELATGIVQPQDAVPYEGSLLQKARAYNDLRRKEESGAEIKEVKKEPEKTEEKPKKESTKRAYYEGWYEDSLKAEDQVQWVMDTFNLTKTKAKNKLYQWRYAHKTETKVKETKQEEAVPDSLPQEVPNQIPEETSQEVSEDVYMTKFMEKKLEALMNEQEQYEAKIKELEQEILGWKEKSKRVKESIDTICKTMDILRSLNGETQ